MQWVYIKEKDVQPSLLKGLPSIIIIGHEKRNSDVGYVTLWKDKKEA